MADEDIALVTGHSISRRAPVLHEAYFHKKPALARTKQIAVMEKYRPDVVLPVYHARQFRAALAYRSEFTRKPLGEDEASQASLGPLAALTVVVAHSAPVRGDIHVSHPIRASPEACKAMHPFVAQGS